jgi:hypothetical protein
MLEVIIWFLIVIRPRQSYLIRYSLNNQDQKIVNSASFVIGFRNVIKIRANQIQITINKNINNF